jgi:hypothetical protein
MAPVHSHTDPRAYRARQARTCLAVEAYVRSLHSMRSLLLIPTSSYHRRACHRRETRSLQCSSGAAATTNHHGRYPRLFQHVCHTYQVPFAKRLWLPSRPVLVVLALAHCYFHSIANATGHQVVPGNSAPAPLRSHVATCIILKTPMLTGTRVHNPFSVEPNPFEASFGMSSLHSVYANHRY